MRECLQEVGRTPVHCVERLRAVQPESEASSQQPVLRTLLVSDLEGFTSMLYALGDVAAREVISKHDELLRSSLRAHYGVERAHTGDGVIASFIDVRQAVACAAAIQLRMRRYNKRAAAAARFNMRIGVHAGRPLVHENRLFGAAVNTAVRLCAAASSGEVILSDAVRELLGESSWCLRDLGELCLKGLPAPIRGFALEWRDLGSDATRRVHPPRRAAGAERVYSV